MKVSALKKEARTVGVDQVRAGPPVWIRLGSLLRGSVCFAFSFVGEMLSLLLKNATGVAIATPLPAPKLRPRMSEKWVREWPVRLQGELDEADDSDDIKASVIALILAKEGQKDEL